MADAVVYSEKDRTFTIRTEKSVYQMMVDPYGYLLHLYYGEPVSGSMEYLLTHYDRGFSGNPYEAGTDRTYSLDVLPQEYPAAGTGDYRSVCLMVENESGSVCCDLRYKSHEIIKGKYSIPGLPAVYADEEEAETLEILMEDRASGVSVLLRYGVLPKLNAITRSERITNQGQEKIVLRKAQTACLDFLGGDYELIRFYGRHVMERNVERTPISHGNLITGSRRGTSSHQYNPFFIAAQKGSDEEQGWCYGLSFLYSGNFKGEAERDQFDQTRILLGLQDELFSYELGKTEFFDTPEAAITFSADGLSGLSHQLHRLLRHHVCRGKYKEDIRPIVINNWEATYFDFTGDKILEIADQAKSLGLDMLVLDDGWFGERNSDYSGLGDWHVNEKKLGRSLFALVEEINKRGMKFGLWFEPEMVSEDSDLYRIHPDWAFAVPEKKPVRSRYQLVLDFSRKEVVDYIYEQMCRVLDSANIEYMKWDMNRSICDVYSGETCPVTGGKSQGAVLHRYVLGVYDLLERLLERYPDLLIEGCSGGGGRFDAGMLFYTPQIWCSDNTDAMDRIRIQYGTSFGYPVSAVASHVSACPNHQTGRSTPMETRAAVAMAGSFGYELDLSRLSSDEKALIKEDILRYRKYFNVIHNGDYYRLTNPIKEEIAAWEFVLPDRSEALLNAVVLNVHGNAPVHYLKCKGLNPDSRYKSSEDGKIYAGSALMNGGIPMPVLTGDYRAWQVHFVEL